MEVTVKCKTLKRVPIMLPCPPRHVSLKTRSSIAVCVFFKFRFPLLEVAKTVRANRPKKVVCLGEELYAD